MKRTVAFWVVVATVVASFPECSSFVRLFKFFQAGVGENSCSHPLPLRHLPLKVTTTRYPKNRPCCSSSPPHPRP